MNTFNGGIEEIILRATLAKPGILIGDIIGHVEQKRGAVTKQGVYRVLRKLKKEGKIIIYKSSVNINVLWLEKLRSTISGGTKRSLFGNLNAMKKGEKVVVEGRGLVETDDLWSDAFVNVESAIATSHPLFLYNPHNWTILTRKETDVLHVERLRKKRRPIFLSIGGRTALDRATIELASKNGIHCSVSSLFRSNSYLAVIGDYVFTLKVSRKGITLIEDVFRTAGSVEWGVNKIFSEGGKIGAKIFIEKDEERARTLKKTIGRDFFVPKQNRDF